MEIDRIEREIETDKDRERWREIDERWIERWIG